MNTENPGNSILFQYTHAITEVFPTLVGGAIHGVSLQNRPSSAELKEMFIAEQGSTLKRYGDLSPSDIPSIQAWRKAFQKFGVKPTQYRNAAEALLRRLTKHGDVPSINSVVDLANLISLRYSLPVAVFDLRQIHPPISVRFAGGSENFTPLGEKQAEHPKHGEVIFCDEIGLVVARRWCWRQSDESAARSETSEVLVTIEGHHQTAAQDVGAAKSDLLSLLKEFVAGEYADAALDTKTTVFASPLRTKP